MALAAVQTAMDLEEKKSIHPFFSKPQQLNTSDQNALPNDAHDTSYDPDYEQDEDASKGPKKRGRKPGSVNKKKDVPVTKNQSRLVSFAQPSAGDAAAEVKLVTALDAPNESIVETDTNHDRRKRRKTNSTSSIPGFSGEQAIGEQPDQPQAVKCEAGAATMVATKAAHMTISEPGMIAPISEHEGQSRATTPSNADVVSHATQTLSTGTTTDTKKTIKISRSGKLLSSPPKKEPESTPPKKRRGRKPKSKVTQLVMVLKYGHDTASRQAIGEKIDAILGRNNPALQPVTPKKPPPKPSGPPKPTHPFFLGKSAEVNNTPAATTQSAEAQAMPSPKAQKRTAVTPGKIKAESRPFHPSNGMPAFGGNGSDRKSKQTGQCDAPWPTKETAHVRNVEDTMGPLPTHKADMSKPRKMKGNLLFITEEEDIVMKLASQLQISIRAQHEPRRTDFTAPGNLRLPTRLLTSGVEIQEQVRTQVMSLSRLDKIPTKSTNAHPAVKALFSDIKHTLTPFDQHKCESFSWLQKYAPINSSSVLQTGQESLVLKDWLQNLTVLAVDSRQDGSKADTKKPPKKKRKKIQDDFIVDSDEEEDEEMIDISSKDDRLAVLDWSVSSSIRRARWTRNKNVILVSGPNGCGKSAMVQAVAKDLGFEIFEINPGGRRSGKDIQDKVGDMTENHLVSHERKVAAPMPETERADDSDIDHHSDALQKDLDSGRQGTMMSFFASNGSMKTKPKPKPKGSEPRKASSSNQATLAGTLSQRKSQKQSLILFEEADILYDEDQGFWAQVSKMASQSKRPIVITCTNETLIPIHNLPLAAVLRLSPPPIDLATDYLLVLAGREGHVLERDAVSTLYRSKKCDLRASIAELDFWCQMSVGDQKGGLEWIYQRWPPGHDLDENNRPLHVASKGTYVQGMGFHSHDIFMSKNNICFDRAGELLKESWNELGMDPIDWIGRQSQMNVPGNHTLETLKHLDDLTSSISATDAFCRIDMPSYGQSFEQPTDPSLPPMQEKARFNYTLAAPVLQVDHTMDFSHFDTELLIHSHLLTQSVYGGLGTSDDTIDSLIPANESSFAESILHTREEQDSKHTLMWPDFSRAFDILGFAQDTHPALNTSYNLTASSFDRTFKMVVEDLAPFVRSIVASELVIENRRLRLGNLLTEGGNRSNKRQRTTRAARTALEGGSRDTKRRERWFGPSLNRTMVMSTAGSTWAGLGSATADPGSSIAGSVSSSPEE